jgi:PAS domain S-box-containing protein
VDDKERESLLSQLEEQRQRIEELERAKVELQQVKLAQAAAIKARKREQEFTRVLLEHLSDGVVACDAEGNLVLFNKAARRWHGIDAKRLQPREWAHEYDLLDAAGETPLRTENIPLFRALQGEHVRDAGMAIAAKGQPIRYILSDGDALFDADGEKVGAVVVMHDITARKRTDEQLRDSDAELRALLKTVTDIIFRFDRDGRYLKVMPTDLSLLDQPTEVIIGKAIHEIFPPETADRFLGYIRRALDTGQLVQCEYDLTINGKQMWFAGNVSPMADDTVFFTARDITARKQAEDALHQNILKEELIRAQAAALSELATPLIPISDDVVVMPLVGLVDARRIQEIMETLLKGITDRRASVAILDVTGIRVMDAGVADGLIRAAQAAQLLGARVVITGIRPDMAQSLVSLGSDLKGIITHGTLQSGIAFAMSRR